MTALTQAEWDEALRTFPGLAGHRNDCLKTGEATPAPGPPYYNCIAWSVDTTTEWINPPTTQTAFIEFYQGRGFEECNANNPMIEVDGYINERGMDHAARFFEERWSSKRGDGIRMTHPRKGLEGDQYGDIWLHFKKANPSISTSKIAVATTDLDPIAASKVGDLVTKTTQLYPMLADAFEQNWSAWTRTFNDPKLSNTSCSSDFAKGPESNQNIFGCDLYNKLQADPKKKVDPNNVEEYYVLNKQAKAIVKLYASQMTEFETLTTEWYAAQRSVKESSHSLDYTSGSAYEALLGMGSPAIPLIMERYAREVHSWWPELLHEIVYGTKSGAQSFNFEALYRQWADWFQRNPTARQQTE